MGLIYEFQVILPMKVEEYHVAQLYSVAQASKAETGGGEGVEVCMNEPFNLDDPSEDKQKCPKEPLLDNRKTGQFTHKIFHLASKVPRFIRLIAPKGSLEIHEVAHNAYPYCRTVITKISQNPDYMKDNFFIKIESMHKPGRNTDPNAHNLTPEQLKKRKVIVIDIANDPVSSKDYKEDEDPAKFKSQKTGRGPLQGDWIKEADPVMTAYKLVTCEFKWWGLQTRVENTIMKVERRIFTNFHRQVFCWMDKWYGLTMEDIRSLEDKTKEELDSARQTGEVRGTKEED